MQRGPNWSALRTPVHFFTGWGSLRRRAPTGGCANGIPLKLQTPELGAAVDSMVPLAILTRSAAKASPARQADSRIAEVKTLLRSPGCMVVLLEHVGPPIVWRPAVGSESRQWSANLPRSLHRELRRGG